VIAAAGGRNCGAEGPLRETLSALGAQRTARGCTAQTVCPQHQTSGLCNLQPGFLAAWLVLRTFQPAWLTAWLRPAASLTIESGMSSKLLLLSQAAKAKAGHQTRQRRNTLARP
jgi:hypothetical protein